MRRVLYQLSLLILFGTLLLGACQGVAQTPRSPTPPAGSKTPLAQESPLATGESPLSAAESPLAAPPKIAKGKAAVAGRLFSQATGEPLNHAVVRLAEVNCPEGTKDEEKANECFWALSNAFSPSAFTDETGYFIFLDVDARDYVVLVGDLVGKSAFMNNADGKPVIVTAPANKVTDVGEHQLDY